MHKNEILAFALTFFSYAGYHASRKVFSAIKGILYQEKWMHSDYYTSDNQAAMFGVMDSLFLFFYALGLFASGVIGDRMNLKNLISVGMIASASCIVFFAIGGYLNVHALSFYVALWSMNGIVQSTGWPSNVAVMGKWFSENRRGVIMGFWSGNACFGNILGTMITVICIHMFGNEQGWKAALIAVAGVVGVVAILVHFCLVPDPNDKPRVQYHGVDEHADFLKMKLRKSVDKPISFWKAWCIPGVFQYAMAYACLKSVNYALFFWLPFFLSNSLHLSNENADLISVLYDVAQIAGGIGGGYLTDKYQHKNRTLMISMGLASLVVYALRHATQKSIGILLFFAGVLLGGPANLISTAISADLGTHPSLNGNTQALATVTGIIDGTGSIGAAISQYIVGVLANCHHVPQDCTDDDHCDTVCSWTAVLNFLCIATMSAVACLATMERINAQQN